MISLYGWMPRGPHQSDDRVLSALGAALRVHGTGQERSWSLPGLQLGMIDLAPRDRLGCATSRDGRFMLWTVGEAFSGLTGVDEGGRLDDSAVRHALLDLLVTESARALGRVNGEYQVALWDAREQRLLLAADRFGALPLYWTSTAAGIAFAASVQALLGIPGVSADPDPDAIREAVTFGGFRLGDRTNIRGVRMLRGGRTLECHAGVATERRYWTWPPIAEAEPRSLDVLVDEAHALWQRAVGRRLRECTRPGGTLSGGLDSRAILAEAGTSCPAWTAVTYGVPGCDDVRIAQKAAAHAGVRWVFHPLYGDRDPDWLERRSAHIAHTDGLIDLADLMHLESIEVQVQIMDVHLAGYIGDVVCGPTFAEVVDARGLVQRMPYYGVSIGWTERAALEWAERAIAEVAPGAPRYALFEHKLPQAIHRIFQAGQRHIRVRRPFLDYDLFDFFSRLDGRTRARVYHTMLKTRYPRLFETIPHQLTNAPILTSRARVQALRVCRHVLRRMQAAAARAGLAAPPPPRAFHDEDRQWRVPSVARRIRETILRPGSVSADVFGSQALTAFLDDWFARGGPVQVVGALYVFEHYHRGLATRSPDRLEVEEISRA